MEQHEVRDRALRLLSIREHSRQELARKLAARLPDDAPIDAVLDALEQNNLLSESRFAASYVNERLQKGFGPHRIAAELQQRGIDKDTISQQLSLDDATWAEYLVNAYQRRFGDTIPQNAKERARCARFLEYRGFPSRLIARFLAHHDCIKQP